jgi:hypothetical protein
VAAQVVFLSRMGTKNIGDNLCSPYLYFRRLFSASRHLEFHLGEWERHRWYLKAVLSPILLRSKMLIIGGGGLLALQLFADDLRFWTSAPFCPKVLWGAGHNAHNALAIDQTDRSAYQYARIERFNRIGIRDWGMGYNWVPCASCMNSEFSLPRSEGGGIVAALHYETRSSDTFARRVLGTSCAPVDVVYNDEAPDKVLGKLRTARAVVTNSYHGAYWAILLGKRVVVVGGGSKVRMMKHPPVMGSIENWLQKLDEAEIYPNALEEYREKNLEFSREIVQLSH